MMRAGIAAGAGARLQLEAGQRSITVCSGAWAHVERSAPRGGELRVVLRLAEADYATWAAMLRRAISA
jgi:hypothetical protein